jgi:hypothetical protein
LPYSRTTQWRRFIWNVSISTFSKILWTHIWFNFKSINSLRKINISQPFISYRFLYRFISCLNIVRICFANTFHYIHWSFFFDSSVSILRLGIARSCQGRLNIAAIILIDCLFLCFIIFNLSSNFNFSFLFHKVFNIHVSTTNSYY